MLQKPRHILDGSWTHDRVFGQQLGSETMLGSEVDPLSLAIVLVI